MIFFRNIFYKKDDMKCSYFYNIDIKSGLLVCQESLVEGNAQNVTSRDISGIESFVLKQL